MDKDELRRRTKEFALRTMKLVDALPRSRSANAVANQLVRSGTSIASNYRAACRARSRAEFIAKIGVVEEEADESAFWLELVIEHKLMQ
jgi:four helix bundle protein